MRAQDTPAIWYDSWSNDGRDNNLDGVIDDQGEGGMNGADGTHYGRTYTAKIAPLGFQSIDMTPAATLRTIDVTYKVCIDVPIEAYKAARVPIPTSRWIPTFFAHLKSKQGWRVWETGRQPPELMDGDIVAASNPRHQHAGIVQKGLIDNVINLPGPTAARKYHLFFPSGTNDIVSVPRILFEAVLRVDFVARWIVK